MDQRVRNYLIKAHNKVIAHCRQLLQVRSIPQPDRERIQQRLAGTEAELETITEGATNPHRGQAA